jgi:hypothetical protein
MMKFLLPISFVRCNTHGELVTSNKEFTNIISAEIRWALAKGKRN